MIINDASIFSLPRFTITERFGFQDITRNQKPICAHIKAVIGRLEKKVPIGVIFRQQMEIVHIVQMNATKMKPVKVSNVGVVIVAGGKMENVTKPTNTPCLVME